MSATRIRSGRQAHEIESLENAVVESRPECDAKLLRDDTEALRRAAKNAFDGRTAGYDFRGQPLLLELRHRRKLDERIDVDAIRDIGRNSSSRRMRMIEHPLVLEVAHRIANRRRGNTEAEAARNCVRARRLGGLDIRLNDCLEHAPLALVQLGMCHDFQRKNHFKNLSTRRRGCRAEASRAR